MIELVHLEGYEKRKPKELSGGEQQRVSIVRGLINNPKVLLLDEPLSALDLKLRKKMQIELKQLQKKLGITFIYVTHDQDEALSMSDRIAVIKDGKIEQIGTPVEVYEKPKSIYVADFLGEANIFKGIIKDDTCICEEASIKIMPKFKNDYKVDLIVRPENVKLSKEKNSDLVGTIYEQIYDGAFTKILIKVNKKIIKAIISGNDKIYKKNDEVYLSWDVEDAIILESENNEK